MVIFLLQLPGDLCVTVVCDVDLKISEYSYLLPESASACGLVRKFLTTLLRHSYAERRVFYVSAYFSKGLYSTVLYIYLSMGPYGVPGSRDSWTPGLGTRGLGTRGFGTRDLGSRDL